MNILAPVSNIDEVRTFSKAGANEFYIGYTDEAWINNFNGPTDAKGTLFVPLNGRTRKNANITSQEELIKIVCASEQEGGRLYVTLNAPFYTDNMYPYLRNHLSELASVGINRLIVSDIGLMELISTEFPEFMLTVSCVSQVSSCGQVQFYKNFNVERIVFPRHIPISHVCMIADRFPDLEFECFALCEKCMHGDGFCRSMHGIGAFCKDCWNGTYESIDGTELPGDLQRKILDNQTAYRKWISPEQLNGAQVGNLGCSLCSVGNILQHSNIKSLKLSGRGRSTEFVKTQVQITKTVIELFQKQKSKEFIQKYVQQMLGQQYCVDYTYCIMRGI